MRGAATPTPRAMGASTTPLRSPPDAPSRFSSSCSPPSAPSLPPPRSPDPRPHPRPHLRPPPLALSTRGPGPRQFFGPTISSLVAPNPRFSSYSSSSPRPGTLGLDRASLRLFPLASLVRADQSPSLPPLSYSRTPGHPLVPLFYSLLCSFLRLALLFSSLFFFLVLFLSLICLLLPPPFLISRLWLFSLLSTLRCCIFSILSSLRLPFLFASFFSFRPLPSSCHCISRSSSSLFASSCLTAAVRLRNETRTSLTSFPNPSLLYHEVTLSSYRHLTLPALTQPCRASTGQSCCHPVASDIYIKPLHIQTHVGLIADNVISL